MHTIAGTTTLMAILGYPTETVKSPMIYNPWFAAQGIDVLVVPMEIRAQNYEEVFLGLVRMTNLRGALVTMPHKVITMALVDEVTPTARIAGACNAVLVREDGSLLGDQFDGAGFVRGVQSKGLKLEGMRAFERPNNTCHRIERVMRSTSHEQEERDQLSAMETATAFVAGSEALTSGRTSAPG